MKKVQNQGTKLVTLKHVVSRASKDEDFLNSMLKSPSATLKSNALKLSEADGKKLKVMVAKTRAARENSRPAGPDTINPWGP